MFARAGEASQLQSLCIKADERQGCSQFVRDIGNKIRFQSRQCQFARHVSISEYHASAHQQRKRPKDQERHMRQAMADFRNRRPVRSDSQNQVRENATEAALHFGRSSIPANRSSQRSLLFRLPNHDRERRMGRIIPILIRQYFVQCLREKVCSLRYPRRRRSPLVQDAR